MRNLAIAGLAALTLAGCAEPSQHVPVVSSPTSGPNAFDDSIKAKAACYQRQILKYYGVPDAASDIADAVMVECRAERDRTNSEAKMSLYRLGVVGPKVEEMPAELDRNDRQTVIALVIQSRVKRVPDTVPQAVRPGTKI